MSDWLPQTIAVEAVRTPPTPSDGTIRLDDLAGPSEAMEASGIPSRSSLSYAIRERGFPEPVKQLAGIRLWSLQAVKDWARANRADTEE